MWNDFWNDRCPSPSDFQGHDRWSWEVFHFQGSGTTASAAKWVAWGLMAGYEYSAADITVLEFDESVLKRPGMYFGVALDDPRLPTKLLEAAAGHALHPATRVAEAHSLVSVIEILGDTRFRVTIAAHLDGLAAPRLLRLPHRPRMVAPGRDRDPMQNDHRGHMA